MRLYYLILSTIPLVILLSSLVNPTYAQLNETSQTQTYENRDIGIRFLYPSDWSKIVVDPDCQKETFCILSSQGTNGTHITSTFSLLAAHKDKCECNSLTDFVKNAYTSANKNQRAFSFIADNQTIVGKKYPSWQFESSFSNEDNVNVKSLSVLTTNNETYYNIVTTYPIELQAKVLSQFRNVIDSIEFLPVEKTVPRIPSFMTLNETEQLKANLKTDNDLRGLQILSHNSFTDSVGYLHVVGEVQNNSPTNAQFVQVTGTFYDNNNQVVATDFTYTNPSDIGSGQKAPFDLSLTSASIPVSQIDHYELQTSYQ